MPIPGTGIAPSSGDVFSELTALTRRAFIPELVVQLYFSTPSLMVMLGGAQRSAGGVNQITAPVQGASMVQGAWVGYSGNFNKPQILPGAQVAQWNTSYFLVPVPLVLGEALMQSTEAIIPILDARMNDVRAVMIQQMSSALFTDNSANPLMPDSFKTAFDDGTNVAQYGGIDRTAAGNSFWQGQLYQNAGAILARGNLSTYSIRIADTAGGEMTPMAIMSPADFATLQSTIIGTESVNVFPGGKYNLDTNLRSGFPNISINGVVYFCDHWCPTGTIYYINPKYTAIYLSEDAAFDFSGFYSTIPMMQVAQVGVGIVGYDVVSVKPKSGAQVTGITGAAY